VVVVGGAGFLGSHLVNHLVEDRGCDVLVIDNLCAGRREFVHPKATFEHHDITGSEDRLWRLLYGFGAQFCFNYAAYPYIPVSFARPIHVADVNYMGAMKVINAAQEAGAEAILQVSSAEIYGDVPFTVEPTEEDDIRIGEGFPVTPHSSYGVAKAAVDNWVQVRWREAKIPCIALRQFNCVGERETHPYIVPEIISQLNKQYCMKCHRTGTRRESTATGYEHKECFTCGGSKSIYGPGGTNVVRLGNDSFRDFLYAGDAIKIAVELLERGQFGEVYNLGSETGIKMYDLAKLIGKLMGFADVKVERDEARVRPWEIWHLQADVKKIRGSLSNSHGCLLDELTSLDEALRRTIKWFESNGRKWPWEK